MKKKKRNASSAFLEVIVFLTSSLSHAIMSIQKSLRWIVLLALFFESNAFLVKNPSSSPLSIREVRVPIRIKSANTKRFIGFHDFTKLESTDVVKEERKMILSTIKNGLVDQLNFQRRLLWVCLFALLSVTQVMGGKGISSIGFSSKNVLASTVSASLLRRHSTRSNQWRNIVLVAGLIASQMQVKNLIQWATLGVCKFSVWYTSCLAAFPLYTKASTTAFISFLADATAQFQEERIRVKESGFNFDLQNYDRRRGLAKVCDSAFISGPLLHFSYGLLESLIPVASFSGWYASLAALSHVLIDDFIVDAVFIAIMFVSTGIGEGYSRKQLIPQFKRDYFPTVRAGWATSVVVLPLEFCLFRFLPLNYRVLGMNFIDIIWEAVVSFMVHKRRRIEIKDGSDNIPLLGCSSG